MATQKRNALGRGLDALLSMDDVKTEGSSSINEIELAKITVNPNQPRREFDETALQELADSITEIGIIQPITLRKLSDDEYQIIAGERRYRASQRAGLKTIPAYIRTADDENMMEMALIENIQREDLNAVEIALAYQHLLDQYELMLPRQIVCRLFYAPLLQAASLCTGHSISSPPLVLPSMINPGTGSCTYRPVPSECAFLWPHRPGLPGPCRGRYG